MRNLKNFIITFVIFLFFIFPTSIIGFANDELGSITVDTGGPYQNMIDRTIKFTGTASPSPGWQLTGYKWDFGDGTYVQRTLYPKEYKNYRCEYRCEAEHTYLRNGIYTAKLTVRARLPPSSGKVTDSVSVFTRVYIMRDILPEDMEEPTEYSSWKDSHMEGKPPKPRDFFFSKEVWSEEKQNWSKSAHLDIDDPIKFRITWSLPLRPFGWPLVYPDSYYANIRVYDFLPATVKYVSADPSPISVKPVVYYDKMTKSFVPFTELVWDCGRHHTSKTLQTRTIIVNGVVEYQNKSDFSIPSKYDAFPIYYVTKNYAKEKLTSKQGTTSGHLATISRIGSDTASYFIPNYGTPDIKITKEVKRHDETEWFDAATTTYGRNIDFRLTIDNTGDFPITDPITVKDVLPDHFEYVPGSSYVTGFHYNPVTDVSSQIPKMISQPQINGQELEWILNRNVLGYHSSFSIYFKALIKELGEYVNNASVFTTCEDIFLEDFDSATISVIYEPNLTYTPDSYDFGYLNASETSSIRLEIWNDGTGLLNYTLSEDCPWLSIDTISGNSTGEHDNVTIYIDTTGLANGSYSCDINIETNDGNATMPIYIIIGKPPEIPSTPGDFAITINKPIANRLYFNGNQIFLGNNAIKLRRTLVIGCIPLRVDAESVHGRLSKVEFFVDNNLKFTDTTFPFECKIDEKGFGYKTIKIKVHDNKGYTAEDELDIFNINLR